MARLLLTVGVIPARYDSIRFPGKILAPISGKPMIQHVYERARQAKLLHSVVVATDDQRIMDVVHDFGGHAIMTARYHRNGTDRIAEVLRTRKEDIAVNIQGDEPLIDPESIDEAIRPFYQFYRFHGFHGLQATTLATDFADHEEWQDPNMVKVLCDDLGYALYFSRAPIPYSKKTGSKILAKKHIGLYAYRRKFLLQLTELPPHPLEISENLEQLRILGMGERILIVFTKNKSIGVDVPSDVEKVEKAIRRFQKYRKLNSFGS
ncbi:MAG: 3-deoxy-D-manno-octulosonate cytidylyltransferase [Candidatus Cloacimonetes bacterium 4572_55]|nr:MAG: 3-deoxy-D-manno-octulosonate cytidylyltransferase [Candidatus Cloacimonetes bacterium 4572_55]